MFDPEAIELGLFTLIQTAVAGFGFKKVSRHARMWANTGIENQPALYLIPFGGTITQDQAFAIPKYHLKYMVVAQTRAEADPNTVPQIQLNAVWKAVNDAIAALPPGSKQTLGGLVENAWIDGEVFMNPGILDQQCQLEIPISAITGI